MHYSKNTERYAVFMIKMYLFYILSSDEMDITDYYKIMGY